MRSFKSKKELNLLLQILEESYEKRTWHGPNLRGSIRGLSALEASRRPAKGRHNIWEIVVHAAYWKYIVRRRLLGGKRGSFPLKGSNWFVRPVERSEQCWREDIQLLADTHRALIDATASLEPKDLGMVRKGSKYTNREMIYGVALHDVYHAGQIQLIKRLIKRS